jgi:hypothetical protein
VRNSSPDLSPTDLEGDRFAGSVRPLPDSHACTVARFDHRPAVARRPRLGGRQGNPRSDAESAVARRKRHHVALVNGQRDGIGGGWPWCHADGSPIVRRNSESARAARLSVICAGIGGERSASSAHSPVGPRPRTPPMLPSVPASRISTISVPQGRLMGSILERLAGVRAVVERWAFDSSVDRGRTISTSISQVPSGSRRLRKRTTVFLGRDVWSCGGESEVPMAPSHRSARDAPRPRVRETWRRGEPIRAVPRSSRSARRRRA